MQRQLRADPAADALAGEMLDSDWPREVLLEMAASAEQGQPKEAGRTACGSIDDVREPRERGTFFIEPATCGASRPAGMLHTHPNEPLNPQHSLPDFGLVAFGHFDTSIVVGAETSEVFVAPGGDRGQLLSALRDAMDADVEDMEALWRARERMSGREATAAREQLKDDLEALTRRVDTAAPAVASELSGADLAGVSAAAVATGAPRGAAGSTSGACRCIRDTCRDAGSGMAGASNGIDVREIVVGTVIGDLASVAVQRFVLSG